MNTNELIKSWKGEEEIAYIHGWDFSHIDGRYTEQDDLPWDYRAVIEEFLRPEMKIMDIDTGGGEFLLSLNHPYENTAAMENYPPNVALCKDVLLPLGIDFRPGDGKEKLPFNDGSFNMVINRHGDFNAEEIYRVLKPGGLFITQQVGAENDRELVKLICGETEMPFPEQYLGLTSQKFEDAGFTILRGAEAFRPIRFFDIGALVWFARIIQWEFPDFSVDTRLENIGFLFQQMDLYLQTLGLGVCWLGMGRMNPKTTTQVEGMKFVIMLAFGHPKGEQLRYDLKGFKRKSMEQITDKPDSRLEPARLAPSAVNSQPWYFFHEGDTIHVHCSKKGSRLDAGIALAHLYVANPASFRFFKAEHMTDLPGYGYIGSVTL